MKPADFESWLVNQIEQVVDETVEETARELISVARQQIPLTRRKTRQAIEYQKRQSPIGYQISFRLKFQTRYPSQGTPTERVWHKSWQRVRYHFIRSFHRQLNSRLKRI